MDKEIYQETSSIKNNHLKANQCHETQLKTPHHLEDLPLILWLRGDEPYYNDFCLEPDDVMATLGIKRSRLTQISGRELRVGRVRIDRYIRPRYRLCDLEEYKKQTRATASHQRSSQVVEKASDRLERTIDSLTKNFEDFFLSYHQEQKIDLSELESLFYDLMKPLFSKNSALLRTLFTNFHLEQDSLAGRSFQLEQKIHKIEENLAENILKQSESQDSLLKILSLLQRQSHSFDRVLEKTMELETKINFLQENFNLQQEKYEGFENLVSSSLQALRKDFKKREKKEGRQNRLEKSVELNEINRVSLFHTEKLDFRKRKKKREQYGA